MANKISNADAATANTTATKFKKISKKKTYTNISSSYIDDMIDGIMKYVTPEFLDGFYKKVGDGFLERYGVKK